MEWTHTTPNQVGYYWRKNFCREETKFQTPHVVYIRAEDETGRLYCSHNTWEYGNPLEHWGKTHLGFLWYGPVEPPL